MFALNKYFPNWRELSIHESSPGWDKASLRLMTECANYQATNFDPDSPLGEIFPTRKPCKTYQNEDLENQTFGDVMFDIVFMQDVFEHVFRPDLAVKEIARTLKPGGGLVMTVPLVRQRNPSVRRAEMCDGQVRHLIEPAQYHNSTVSADGALVTIDWGFDIVSYLQHHSDMSFMLLNTEDPDQGIIGDLKEVVLGFKRPIPAL